MIYNLNQRYIVVIGCFSIMVFLGFTFRHAAKDSIKALPNLPNMIGNSFQTYKQLSPLEEQRSHSTFFCSDVHPIAIPGVMDYDIMVNGMKLSLALFESGDIVSNAIKQAGWEMNEIAGIVKKLDQARASGLNPTFLDIGSNVGWFSVQAASRGYKTISFDAMRANGKRTLSSNNV
jgi:hypothetical protein